MGERAGRLRLFTREKVTGVTRTCQGQVGARERNQRMGEQRAADDGAASARYLSHGRVLVTWVARGPQRVLRASRNGSPAQRKRVPAGPSAGARYGPTVGNRFDKRPDRSVS
jgi:hypothetical protein